MALKRLLFTVWLLKVTLMAALKEVRDTALSPRRHMLPQAQRW